MGAPYVTLYRYDALDNLTCAVQKGSDTTSFTDCASAPASWRPRSFVYDSLSRLTSASNPESGTVTYSYAAETTCNPAGEELRTKTDARGLVTTYCYDAEHRVTQKTFSDSTPALYFTYDVAPSWMSDPTNVVDRLVEANNQYAGASGSIATALVNSYDSMGRVKRRWQQTPSTSPGGFFVYADYDLAGNPLDLTYPSGRKVNFTFDAVGRLQKAYSMSGSEYDFVKVSAFWPTGAWSNASYGNGTQQQDTYNPRLQPSELKLLNGGGGAIADRQYVWTGCGPAQSGADNGNVCGINDVLNSAHNQAYNYDALNRIVAGSQMRIPDDSDQHSWLIAITVPV
ncbi:MAG TPA: RHS repeat domain-containing protein [Candidatus Angelobacter sp.]|nr:RHS repeat domain-containing protein [Candidatus Angelobacter sp.]